MGADTNAIFKPCRGRSVEEQVSKFYEQIDKSLYNYIWIEILPD